MQSRILPCLSLFAALGSLTAAALLLPARAADIGDLKSNYSGSAHDTARADQEDIDLGIEVTGTQPNGKFTAQLEGTPLDGKVTSTGRVIFSGQSNGAPPQKIKGKAQLSATGRFLVGSFTVSQKGEPKHTYLFSMEEK